MLLPDCSRLSLLINIIWTRIEARHVNVGLVGGIRGSADSIWVTSRAERERQKAPGGAGWDQHMSKPGGSLGDGGRSGWVRLAASSIAGFTQRGQAESDGGGRDPFRGAKFRGAKSRRMRAGSRALPR